MIRKNTLAYTEIDENLLNYICGTFKKNFEVIMYMLLFEISVEI